MLLCVPALSSIIIRCLYCLQDAGPECYSSKSHVHMKHLSQGQFAALKSAERKMLTRVLLLNVLLMFVNYIDRTNLSFAAVQLNRDIGLDHQTYGLGAGGAAAQHGAARTGCAQAAAQAAAAGRLLSVHGACAHRQHAQCS